MRHAQRAHKGMALGNPTFPCISWVKRYAPLHVREASAYGYVPQPNLRIFLFLGKTFQVLHREGEQENKGFKASLHVRERFGEGSHVYFPTFQTSS